MPLFSQSEDHYSLLGEFNLEHQVLTITQSEFGFFTLLAFDQRNAPTPCGLLFPQVRGRPRSPPTVQPQGGADIDRHEYVACYSSH